MELSEVLLILGIFLPLFFMGIWQLNRLNVTKKGVKAGDSSIKEMYSVYNQQVNDVLKIKDKQISSISAKLRSLESEEYEEEEKPAMNLEGIKPLLASRGINPALLDLPFVQNLIKKYTKDMSIEDITQLISTFAGNKQPTQPDSSTAQTGQNPNYF